MGYWDNGHYGQTIQNANSYLNTFQLGGTGLTPEQQRALSLQGIDTGVGAINSWQKNITDGNWLEYDAQAPLVSMMANEGRYREALGLNTLQSQLAQSQLNETGGFMANNRNARFGEMVGTDQDYSRGMGEVMKSFDTARNELDMAGQGAVSGLLARERQQIAGTQQNMQSRGLGSTSVMDNARQGIQQRTGRDIASVQENVGGMRSNVAQNRAGAQQSMYGTQANLRQENTRTRYALDAGMSEFMKQRTNTETGLMGNRINLIQSMNDQARGTEAAPDAPSNEGANWIGALAVAAPILAAVL